MNTPVVANRFDLSSLLKMAQINLRLLREVVWQSINLAGILWLGLFMGLLQ